MGNAHILCKENPLLPTKYQVLAEEHLNMSLF